MVKTGFSRIFPPGSRLRDRKYRNRLSVFLACLSIASFVWVVIKLSKDFTITINWPVHYVNVPMGRVLALKSDTTLVFQIRARGFDLLPTYFRGPSERVMVDLAKVRYLRNKGRLQNAYLLSDDIKSAVAGQLNLNEEIVSIQPDTLFFQLTPMLSRKVPVVVPVEFSAAPAYGLYGTTTVTPDSVRVEGPAALIDTLRSVVTKRLKLGILSSTSTSKVSLQSRYQKLPLSFSCQSFKVTVPIEKFTEATVTVPVTALGDTCRMRFFPDRVNLIVLVAMRDYKRIEPSAFHLEVGCSEALSNHGRFITPKLTISPDFTKLIRQEPPQVEYIILK